MLRYFIPRLTNVSLRLLALVSRFALVIVLARLLEPVEVGTYGLFSASIAFSMLMLGGDYYTYSQRKFLSETKERWSFVLQHQAIALAMLYIVMLPAQLLIFAFDFMPWHLAGWFFALLIIEHIAQEINRLLVVMRRQLLASWVLFLRMGVWIWAILPLMWIDSSYRQIETVFAAWLGGGMLAISVGTYLVWREVRPWRRWSIDWSWLCKGFTVGVLYLISTMSFRALHTFDRYSVEELAGPAFLGAYVLYSGMALAVISVVDSGVFLFLYPSLVAAQKRGEHDAVRKLTKELAWSALAVSLAVGMAVSVFAPWVVAWIGKPLYAEHLHVLWLLLLMSLIYAMGMVAHYGLYALDADKTITLINLSALLVFFVALGMLANSYPLEATALALILAFFWMGTAKYIYLRKFTHRAKTPI